MTDKIRQQAIEAERFLIPGALYRIIWPDHYKRHQKIVGYVGEFIKYEDKHCQLRARRHLMEGCTEGNNHE